MRVAHRCVLIKLCILLSVLIHIRKLAFAMVVVIK